MKLLFVHDHIFKISKEGVVYSSFAYPKEVWGRYLKHFDTVMVIGRGGEIKGSDDKGMVESSVTNVSFEFVKYLSSPKGICSNLASVNKKIKNSVIKSDAVVARLPSENGLLAISYAKKLNKPYAVELVGCPWDALWNHGKWLAKLYAPVAAWRVKKAVWQSSHNLYVTKEYLQRKYPSKQNANVVSASNIELLHSSSSRLRGFSDGRLIFGVIGSYKTRYKGVHIAISALAKLKKDLPEFELRILGSGDSVPYEKIAESLGIASNVKFCGSLPNGEPVMDWLDNIDIYMQPSLTEGLPRALIEAMSRGCVCIGSDAGGIPELLSSEFIHKKGNADDLMGVIDFVMKNPSKWSDFSQLNKEESKGYYKEILDNEREKFYSEFRKDVEAVCLSN